MQRILIVEDDIEIQDMLRNYLTDAGYEVVLASDGVTGIAKFDDTINLVLLDIMLPKLTAMGYVRSFVKDRKSHYYAYGSSDEENQIKGFEQQIDDYIPKPFSPKILLYKIAAIFRRRSSDTQKQTSIVYKDLCMDIDGFHLYHKGKEIVLTQKEFSLLRLMIENQGKVFTRQMLLDRLWDSETFVEDRIVDSHIKNIRKKLDADYIETIRGVGYRIDKEN